MRAAILTTTLAGSSCTSDEWPPLELAEDDGGDDADGGGDDSDNGDYDRAYLEVFEPEGASIHPLGEPMPLIAEVRRADGAPLPFDDVYWVTTPDAPTLHDAAEGEVVLPPGIYDIAAVAELPNGDRLETRVSDVRVQSRWTGRYDGEVVLQLSVMFAGIALAPVCRAPLALQVGFDGQMSAFEEGSCTLDAVVAQLQVSYTISGALTDNGIGQGQIDFDLGGLAGVTMDWTGGFVEDGFSGGFSGQTNLLLVGAADVAGVISLDLIDPYLDP
jgi:hypothetical protein